MATGTSEARFSIAQEYEYDQKRKSALIILTTYSMATSSINDRAFLRRCKPSVLVVDEAHFLKNYGTQKYTFLSKISSKHRFLLTGTPLQNGNFIVAFALILVFDS